MRKCSMPGTEANLRKIVERHIREGFASEEAILDLALREVVDERCEEKLIPILEKIINHALISHEREESKWLALTDCDRLDRAFSAMEHAGVVARQHFSCCNNCGHKEIELEIRRKSRHGAVKGYAFYHREDTERAARSGLLYITFGLPDAVSFRPVLKATDSKPANVLSISGGVVSALDQSVKNEEGTTVPQPAITGEDIGQIVTKALQDQGLEVIWNGTYLQRICVTGMNWQKRRMDASDYLAAM